MSFRKLFPPDATSLKSQPKNSRFLFFQILIYSCYQIVWIRFPHQLYIKYNKHVYKLSIRIFTINIFLIIIEYQEKIYIKIFSLHFLFVKDVLISSLSYTSVIIIMQKAHTQQPQLLPRIQSHGKITKNSVINRSDNKNTQQEVMSRTRIATSSQKQTTGRPNSERKTLQSANSLKSVRYQTTNALYAKKIENLERQSQMLDKQIQQKRQQVAKIKKNRENVETSTVEGNEITKSGQQKIIKCDKSVIMNKMDALRRKIDTQNERNSKIQKEIDKVRKQINTTKKLNNQLQTQLITVKQLYDNEIIISTKFQHQIAKRNEQVHLKKIQLIHKKAHVIKNYDQIIKKIDQQMDIEKINKNGEVRQAKSDFYITDIYQKQKIKFKKIKQLPQNSPKSNKKNTATQNIFLKSKIQQFQQKFSELKQKTKTNSIEQATNNFLQQYQTNYNHYKFINERYSYLQDIKQKNIQLQNNLNNLKKQLKFRQKNKTMKQIEELQEVLIKINENKENVKRKINNSNIIYGHLKQFIINFINKMPLNIFSKFNIDKSTNLETIINPQNVAQFLNQILNFKNTLPQSNKVIIQEHMVNSSRSNHHNVEEYLDTIKHEQTYDKDKLFNRDEYLKNQEIFTAKKKGSLKNHIQKH